jgi:flagellar biosynthetic protein FlhB
MAEDFDRDQRTELPTERRRVEIREQGNVAKSADLNAAASIVASCAMLFFFGQDLVSSLMLFLKLSLSGEPWRMLDVRTATTRIQEASVALARTLLPVAALAWLTAVTINLVQVGFLLTSEPLVPKWSRLNPVEGFKRLFSMRGGARLASSLLKLAVLVAIAVGFVIGQLPALLGSMDLAVPEFCRQLGSWLVGLALQLSIGLLVLALFDYGFQRWKFEQDIKMTKEELRQELRHMEGDPHVRQRRREAHRKLTRARHLQQVRTADAVVTNPTQIAVALKYEPARHEAPVVVAKGTGFMAQRIRQIAAEHGVPIIEKKPLAQALYRLVRVGQPIPLELYEAVAEILAYVYRLANKSRRGAA